MRFWWRTLALLALAAPPLWADQAAENAVRESYAATDPARLASAAEALESAVATAPEDLHLREALGLLYLDKLKQSTKALPHLEKIVAARPADAAWTEALARAAWSAGKLERSAELYARTAQARPADPWPRHEQAQVLSQMGRHAEAAKVLREALTLNSPPAYLRLALARELVAADRPADAWPLLETYVREKPDDAAAQSLFASLPRPQAHTAQAIAAAYQSGERPQYESAAALLESDLRESPGDLAQRKTLAFTLLDKLHRPAQALPHLEQISSAAPDDPVWLGLLARAERELGRHDQAVAHLRRCVELQPGEAWLRVSLGWELLAKGRVAEALAAVREVRGDAAAEELLKACQAATRKAPSPLDQAVALAYQTGDHARFAAAASLLESYLKAHPGDLARRKTLAFTWLDKLKDPRAALPHLRAVAAALPRDAGWAALLARGFDDAGDARGAVDAWRQAAALAPRDPWARYHLGQALLKLARAKEAAAAFEEALALDPRNPYVQVELGKLSLDGGRRSRALAFAHAALSADPANADAHVLLGDLYRGDFNFRAARKEYGTVLDLNPAYNPAQQGVEAMSRDERAQAKLVYFTFTDTDHYHQSGLFGYFTPFTAGPFRLSPWANELFFYEKPGETIERFETGLDVQWRLNHWLQLTAGVSRFKTSNLNAKSGYSAGLYLSPARCWDCFVTWREDAAINDSYFTALHAFHQNVLTAGLNIRPLPHVTASLTASTSDYYAGHSDFVARYVAELDRNERRYALGALAWDLYPRAGAALKVECQYLDFNHHSNDYSSPQQYTIVRPVLELAPQVTSWLRLEFRGELPYVLDARAWGTGLSIGPRITRGDWLDFSLRYLHYRLPDFQTNWSGSGVKAELVIRF